jgi:arylsulfatase A-like enzyme
MNPTNLQSLFFVLACTMFFPFDAVAADSAKSNIILFFVDDFGQRDLSCYGSELYETPHMDRLAADGMRFTNAYSAYPRCVPSRQGLMSGKYPSRIEFESSQSGNQEHHLPLSEVTFGEALKEDGYQTCYIGKWHLGHEGGDPGKQGFDTIIHTGSAGATGSYFYPFPTEKGLTVQNPVKCKEGDYLTDRLTDEAVNYIAKQGDKPFLMVMAHYAVHTPLEAPEETERKYKKKIRKMGIQMGGKRDDPDLVKDRQGFVKTVQNNPTYAAMVEATDTSLGRIVKAVKDAGKQEETIIIMTSDHGGLSTRGTENHRPLATSNSPLRQGKGSIFEGGTRVPLIVKWPGRVQPGTVSKAPVTGTDHYPTMLAMVGSSLRPQQHVDGRNYVTALLGQPYQRDPMFWYKWQARPDSTGDTRAISYLDGDYKLIQWLDEDLVELFDLSKDISEQENLANQMPERTQAMLASLHAMEADVGNLRKKGLKQLERRLNRNKQNKSRKKGK